LFKNKVLILLQHKKRIADISEEIENLTNDLGEKQRELHNLEEIEMKVY